MIKWVLPIFLLLGCQFTYAQVVRVPVSFEIDGRAISAKPKIWFVIGSRTIRAKVEKGSIWLRDDNIPLDEFALRAKFKGNVMTFMGLTSKDLKASWTIAIDNRPFEKDDFHTTFDYTGLSRVYLLKVRPADDGISTVLIARPEGQRRGEQVPTHHDQ